MDQLLEIMARLRNPVDGCPWDVEQTFSTIAPHTIEEAYEVAEAIERNDMNDLKDELGDLLLQVVFHSRMAEEQGSFKFSDVVDTISQKMLSRHPHVFGDVSIETAEDQTVHWEDLKAVERETKHNDSSTLAGVINNLPALLRAQKLQKRASRVGFDWGSPGPVFDKIVEETAEIKEAIEEKADLSKIEEELGDLLFCCVNLSRQLGIDAETALRRGNMKFERRFRQVENFLADEGSCPEKASLDEMEQMWEKAKREERG